MKKGRKERIGFRCSKELKNSLQELADKDDRKLGDFLNVELERLVNEQKQDGKA